MVFSHLSCSPGRDLLLQLWYSFPSKLFHLKHFLFVPIAFQKTSEISRPLFDHKNEGFMKISQELHFSRVFGSTKCKYSNGFWFGFLFRNWTVPTWGKWSLMSDWISWGRSWSSSGVYMQLWVIKILPSGLEGHNFWRFPGTLLGWDFLAWGINYPWPFVSGKGSGVTLKITSGGGTVVLGGCRWRNSSGKLAIRSHFFSS